MFLNTDLSWANMGGWKKRQIFVERYFWHIKSHTILDSDSDSGYGRVHFQLQLVQLVLQCALLAPARLGFQAFFKTKLTSQRWLAKQ